MLRPHWEGFWGRKGSLGALSRDHLGEGGKGRNRGGLGTCRWGKRNIERCRVQVTCPLQYLLGLIIASLEEGEKPTHVESRCSEAV